MYRVVELEREVSRLEDGLDHAMQWGVDPAKVEVPEELGEEIDSLSVHPPFFQTLISIFPGCFIPGLGAHTIGDSETGWNRLGEAYTGVGELAIGTGLTAFSVGVAVACAYGGECSCDGLGELFVTGVGYMVLGPYHYMEAWLGDVASTYGAREHLEARVEILKARYLRFLVQYESACRSYRSGN
jgi:hypothetical protein